VFPPNTALRSLRRRALPLVTFAAGLLGMAPAATAATRQVAPGGADAGECLDAACGSLGYAYGRAAPGDVVQVASGTYGAQDVPAGSKAVTFHGAPGAKVRELDNSASNVTFDGIEVDAGFAKTAAFENHGSPGAENVIFKNAAIGNVIDEKGALVSGTNFTFDHVLFHDVLLQTDGVHLECVYAIGVPGITVRNSTFHNCGVMDLFFTYGDWWSPLPPAYGNVTLENNVFEHSLNLGGDWHAYGLYVAATGPPPSGGTLDGWTVRNNTFETDAYVERPSASGSRWVGNLGTWNCVTGVSYSHNVGKKCAGTDTSVSPAASTASVVAPLGWVNAPGGDFHLLSSSPAIGAADPNDAPATEHDGYARDSRPDAGAYEFGAGPASAASGAPSSGGGARGVAPRLRSIRLSPRIICHKHRRKCPTLARLNLRASVAARVSVRLERLRRGHKAHKTRSFAVSVGTKSRTTRIRARGLRAGRYRVVMLAWNNVGKSASKTLRLRVRG
jgi:hypothetical protein